MQVISEEDAIVWLWARPSLLPWPREVAWLFSLVTGKDPWPGDLWGVDSDGELIIIENKKGPTADPFADFVDYPEAARSQLLASNLENKWLRHHKAELRFPDTFIDRRNKTDGILPRSLKRVHIRRWPLLAVSIDAGIRDRAYKHRVRQCLNKRRTRNSPPPQYCGLLIATRGRDPRLSKRGHRSMKALRQRVGSSRVHLFVARANLLETGEVRKVEITFSRRT